MCKMLLGTGWNDENKNFVVSLYKKWEDINGVTMTSFAKHLRESKYNKPEILNIRPEDLLGEEVALSWINLREDKTSDLDSYNIQHVVGASKNGLYQGLCVWFECNFPNLLQGKEENCVILDTSPRSVPTHWKQTIIVLPKEQEVEKGEPIAFQLDMNRDPINNRRYNLEMTLLDPEAVEHPQPCSCHMTKCIIIKTFMQQHAEHAIESNLNSSNTLEDDKIDDDEEE